MRNYEGTATRHERPVVFSNASRKLKTGFLRNVQGPGRFVSPETGPLLGPAKPSSILELVTIKTYSGYRSGVQSVTTRSLCRHFHRRVPGVVAEKVRD